MSSSLELTDVSSAQNEEPKHDDAVKGAVHVPTYSNGTGASDGEGDDLQVVTADPTAGRSADTVSARTCRRRTVLVLGALAVLAVVSVVAYFASPSGGSSPLTLARSASSSSGAAGPVQSEMLGLLVFGAADAGPEPVRTTAQRSWWGFARLLHALTAQTAATADAASGNVVFSPLCVWLALAMASVGAEGDTRSEFFTLVHPGQSSATDPDYGALLSSLQHADPGFSSQGVEAAPVELELANSLWSRPEALLRDEFRVQLQQLYSAEALPLTGVDPVNAWISNRTHGLIPQMLQSLSPDAVALLVSAVFFRGPWTNTFTPMAGVASFYDQHGAAVQSSLQFMQQRGAFRYLETSTVQVVELPLGYHEKFSAIVVLPKPAAGAASLDSWLSLLTAANTPFSDSLPGLARRLRVRTGLVQLPRFRVAPPSSSLKKSLQALGLVRAFTPGAADFTRMSTAGDLYIDEVLHQAVLEADEKGLTAAAAVMISFSRTSGPTEPLFTVRAERPFLLFLCDTDSYGVLFAAAIRRPDPLPVVAVPA